MTDTSKKREAQSHFKKARQEGDAKNAMLEYEARAVAIRERTEQLKALRLAREASEQAAAPTPKTKTKTAGRKNPAKTGKTGNPGKKSAATLADWLNEQGRSGRRS
jgi:hypothetical protein